jgi:hypothetical protein
MVKVETRIQQAVKEILEEETWKHLKTNNNFDKVLSIASLIEPFDEGLEPCYEDCRGMCFGCYDGYTFSLDWRDSSNLRRKTPFSLITDHELEILIDTMDDKIHKCERSCSDFICYEYEATSCKTWYCLNLLLKHKKNIKYCSKCRGM